jgi:hypothetical protein
MLKTLWATLRRGDRVFVDPRSDEAPLNYLGAAGSVSGFDGEFVYVVRPGDPSQAPMKVPVGAVRAERRHRFRA